MRASSALGMIVLAGAVGPSAAEAAKSAVTRAPVVSEVYPLPGAPERLAAEASTCMAQLLRSGLTTAPVILSSDLPGGVVVARNRFDVPMMAVRTRVTFEARQDRFRITHDDMEASFGRGNWFLLGEPPRKSKSDPVGDQLAETSARLAACVKARMQSAW